MLNFTAKRLEEIGPNTLLVGIDIGKKKHACVIMDLTAKVPARFKLSNCRESAERPLKKLGSTRRESQADHLLFRMEPTRHHWGNPTYFFDRQEFRFRPCPDDARIGWSTLSPGRGTGRDGM